MRTNTAAFSPYPRLRPTPSVQPPRPQRSLLVLLFCLAALPGLPGLRAETLLGPWIPMFQGVDHAIGTNTPANGGFPNLQVIHAIRVDLQDPDVRLFTSPKREDYTPGSAETDGYTMSDFVRVHGLQVAINSNFFDPGQYYLPARYPMVIDGLFISQGTVVSTQDNRDRAAALLFTEAKEPSLILTNWPPAPTDGIHTAVSGEYAVVIDGVNVGYQYEGNRNVIHRTQPRTAFGLSQDRRYLYLLTIDGRQPGYSLGALDWETGAWMLLLGAHDAINMDGGGSTTLVVGDSTGAPVPLNRSNAVADSGNERTIGAHFGVYAPPLPGFINDLTLLTNDTSATVSWTTLEPATAQIAFGVTTDLGTVITSDAPPSTQHRVVLTGLTPDTRYYLQAIATTATASHVSPLQAFTTTYTVTSVDLFDLSQPWRFTTDSLDGQPWTTPEFNDSAWAGAGPGLLWIDVRATGPNPEVTPKTTLLPANDANAGYPFVTYYFRTEFTLPSVPAGAALRFITYLDDGAVFHLNGSEIYRTNMPPAPEPILNDTLASGFSYDGDATGPIPFTVPGSSLRPGSNVLAVEVHNYNALSPDITFGAQLQLLEPVVDSPALQLTFASGTLTLSWSSPGFILQSAPTPGGPWTDLPGPVADSPHLTTVSEVTRYFRLRR